MNRIEYLGGEKLFPLSLLFKKRAVNVFDNAFTFEGYFKYFTFGAHSSLLAVLDHLQISHKQFVLLPSYLCESVLCAFKQRSVNYIFYSVNSGLQPDFQDISAKMTEEVRAILFIDYMGYSQYSVLQPYQAMFARANVRIIQDAAQSVMLDEQHLYGHYVINSYRKITGVEGGMLLSKQPMQIQYAPGSNFRFLFLKRVGQALRYLHLNFPSLLPAWFLFVLTKAESVYYNSKIYKLPRVNRYFLSRIDFNAQKKIHAHLNMLLRKSWGSLQPAHVRNSNAAPLGYFMLTDHRNTLLKNLAAESIFCPVHWRLPAEISRDKFFESWQVSEKALTIPFAFPMTMSIETIEERVNHIINTSLTKTHEH